ncbi:magnesium transporter CorA family protein [Comamonas composti]|uniref:magnesium transporter CorA family protein n=1 Tax=Comamonas composti TaxID=408558 RepID=UPI00041FD61C|nr:magnesium transporter CorA family protein [Comamonas composti]
MQVLHIAPGTPAAQPLDGLPAALPASGFYWLSCSRSEFESQLPELQRMLAALCGTPLVDLHVSDLLNAQLPSNYDYTSAYDILVFQRLASQHALPPPPAQPGAQPRSSTQASHRPAQALQREDLPVLQRIETRPVGFALFDHLLLSIHPDHCPTRDTYLQRLLSRPGAEAHGEARTDLRGDVRTAVAKLPTSPADLMLRMVNTMVDGYLDLRRVLTRQLDHWQLALLHPKGRFSNWSGVLDARLALHQLDEICEDQRAAMQDWLEALDGWPLEDNQVQQREHELLKVRSRDLLEHIERVLHHIRRMEQSAESAVQMHFSAQSNRANDIMRTLTTVTAVFLPLNLIAGIFGMNFEFIPFVHLREGFWWAMATMGLISLVLIAYFWRKRYLEREDDE